MSIWRLDLRSAAVNEQFNPRAETGVIPRQKQGHLATSSGSPLRPIGMAEAIRASTSGDCRLASALQAYFVKLASMLYKHGSERWNYDIFVTSSPLPRQEA